MNILLVTIVLICFAYLLARMFSIIVHSTSKEPLEGETKALLRKRQNEDFEWLLENYEGLFEQYGDCYLLIRNKRVICTCDSYTEGVKDEKNRHCGVNHLQYKGIVWRCLYEDLLD